MTPKEFKFLVRAVDTWLFGAWNSGIYRLKDEHCAAQQFEAIFRGLA